MHFSRSVFTVVALVAFTGVIQAQDFKVGGQLTLSIPQGDVGNSDFLDGKLGYGLGLHGVWDLSDGHAIVPRLDYTMYKKTDPGGYAGWDLKVNNLAIGADYNYYFNGKSGEGFYLLGGLGYSSFKWEVTVPVSSVSISVNETKGALYLAIGGGFMFTQNLGAELRYTHAKYTNIGSNVGASEDITCPAINASLILRF